MESNIIFFILLRLLYSYALSFFLFLAPKPFIPPFILLDFICEETLAVSSIICSILLVLVIEILSIRELFFFLGLKLPSNLLTIFSVLCIILYILYNLVCK